MADVSWLVAENPLTFGGTVGIAAEDPPLDLSVKGLVDLRVLSALTSAVAFDGNANVNTRIEGTVAKPLLDGRIMLDGAEIAIAEPRVVLSELNGPIVLDGQLAVFDGVRGLANGGALALDGSLEFEAHGAQRRRAQHPGAGRRARIAEGPAQRARCAGDLPARSAQPVADRRHPHRAERLYRDDHDRGAGAAGGAAGDGADRRRASVSRSAAAQSRGDDHRRHDRRQQLRPPCRRRQRARDRHRRRSPAWTAASRCARAGRSSWPAAPSGSRAATFPSPIAATSIPSSTSPPKRNLGTGERQRHDDADRHARAADDRSDLGGRIAHARRDRRASWSARPTPKPR